MRLYPILVLAVGPWLSACDDGPPTDVPSTGTLAVSTATAGDDPDLDGYLLTVDGVVSLSLDPTGSSEIGLRSGPHTLRLLGVADQCSVALGASLEVDVPSQGRISVAFEVNCPAPLPRASGIVRITASTMGFVPSTFYTVWDDHFGAWDYGGSLNFLGAIEPNGILVTEVPSSSESGADPYWYRFELANMPGYCSVQLPQSNPEPGFTIAPGDTLDLEFTVTCTPGE